MQVGGGYVGAMIGGGLFLVLVERAGWSTGILAAAALVAVLTLPAAVTREHLPASAGQGSHRPSLADALGRPAIRFGLVAVLLVQGGLRLSQGMTDPFLIDRGFDLELLGVVSGIAGTGASLVGTLVAGLLLRQLDVASVLHATVAAMLAVLAGFVAAALVRDLPWQALAGLVLSKSLVIGALFVTLYTAMMGWSSLRQAGVDFTLFQCADAAMAAVAGVAGGQLAHHLGYGVCFGLAAALALVAWLALPVVVRRAAGVGAGS
jgi:MFS transporter (putative signal transducer)